MDGQYPYPSHSDPRYAVYDARQMMNDPRVLGPETHTDGVAFWYRPDSSKPAYDRNNSLQSRQNVLSRIDHVKHRRTRSGCFTCRSRRVKCDETRPICDRCRKGHRECEFPQPPNSKSSGRPKGSGTRGIGNDEGQSSEDDEEEELKVLDTIKDEDADEDSSNQASISPPYSGGGARNQAAQSSQRKRAPKQQSVSPIMSKEKARSPSTDTSSSVSGSQTPASSLRTVLSSSTATSIDQNAPRPRWAHLKQHLQKYLQFHQDHITRYHYFTKIDTTDFVHTELIDLALGYEPLLYAVVSFAAYHHTLKQPKGELSHFLGYYGQSLSLLRKSLESDEPQTEATLITMLQLATFEEYLGDWVNLVGHHQAAHQMLLALFTPESVNETDMRRQVFAWYARFDIVAGLLAGNEAVLSREWYVVNKMWYEHRSQQEDADLDNNLYLISATNRLIASDMAALFSRLSRGRIGIDDFVVENQDIARRLIGLRELIQAQNDGYYRLMEFPDRQPLGPDDIVDPYIPGGLFRDDLWPLNFKWVDWYGLDQMHKYQTSVILQQPIPPEMETMSLEQCRIYEAIERWPESPEGSVLGANASLGLATVFLQKDERHTMWCRRRLANVEQLGYIYPTTFRSKMAEIWHLPEITRWWLPNDEGQTPLLRKIRAFGEERAAQPTNSQLKDDLKDMKAIFSKLNLDDESPKSSPSTTSGSGRWGPSPPSVESEQTKDIEQESSPRDRNARVSDVWDGPGSGAWS